MSGTTSTRLPARNIWCRVVVAAVLSLSLLTQVVAAEETERFLNRLWNHTILHFNDSDPYVQELRLSGRLQLDVPTYHADEGQYNDIRWRRVRLGFIARAFRDFHARLEADFELNGTPDYERLTDAYIAWQPSDKWTLTTLKQSAPFTLDGATSSTSLLTPERNNLSHNLWFEQEYFTGVSLHGTLRDVWSYRAGVYSADGDRGLSNFSSGYFYLLSLGHDLGPRLGFEEALLRIDYVNADDEPNSSTRYMEHVLSLVSSWNTGAWEFRADLSGGLGYEEQSNLWGFVLMPVYNFNKNLQGVVRFTYLDSDDPNGLRLNKYEDAVTSGRGNRFIEYFAGVNWYFFGQRLKAQLGVNQATMWDQAHDGGEYKGWGAIGALRVYW